MSSPFPEYFTLFGIAPQFAIDPQALMQAYRRVQVQVHPDRHAAAGPAERRAAMQLASHANEAYDVLRSDIRRAAHLCQLQGIAIEGEGAAPLPPVFLQRQMDWHERLDEARAAHDGPAIAALDADVAGERAAAVARIAELIDQHKDCGQAAPYVRVLMFLDKMAADIGRAAAERADVTEAGQ